MNVMRKKFWNMPTKLNEMFELGMDRDLPDILPFPNAGEVLNLGSGRKLIDKTIPLDADRGWHAPNLDGYTDGTIGGVYAIHFLEHLTKDELMMMLREIERVLMPGGSLITVLPLAGSEISFQDLDHKTFWTEGTWSNLLDNGYYDGTMPREWKFKLHLNIIMGLVQRNLVLISQLVKEERQ